LFYSTLEGNTGKIFRNRIQLLAYYFEFVLLPSYALLENLEYNPDNASKRQTKEHDIYLLRVYSVEILVMMDGGLVRYF